MFGGPRRAPGQIQEQRALADRSRGLEQLLELRDRTTVNTTGAEIIASGASSEFKTVTIDNAVVYDVNDSTKLPAGVNMPVIYTSVVIT